MGVYRSEAGIKEDYMLENAQVGAGFGARPLKSIAFVSCRYSLVHIWGVHFGETINARP